MGSVNGRIVIDPDAAAQDIQRMRQSIALLEEMSRKLQTLLGLAQMMRGLTGTAIVEKSQELMIRIKNEIENLETAILCIQRTVQKYEQKDENLARVIAHGGGGRRF